MEDRELWIHHENPNHLALQMPVTSIADLEIHEPSMDLIAATETSLFDIPESFRPWHNLLCEIP